MLLKKIDMASIFNVLFSGVWDGTKSWLVRVNLYILNIISGKGLKYVSQMKKKTLDIPNTLLSFLVS